MKRELSRDKNQLIRNDKKRSKKDTGNKIKDIGIESKNSIDDDFIDINKLNNEIFLKKNINSNNLNEIFDENFSENRNSTSNDDFSNLKDIINKLEMKFYNQDYLDYVFQINVDLKQFSMKPKFIGIDLKSFYEEDSVNKIKEIKNATKILKSKIDSSNSNFQVDSKLIDSDKINRLKAITDFKIITPIEIFYKHEFDKFHKISNELDKCSICLFEFYEELIIKTQKIIKQDYNKNELNNLDCNKCIKSKACEELIKFQIYNNSFDVVLLNDCNDHFFHIDCLINMIGEEKQYTKCPNCNVIYGIMVGDQPNGTMQVTIDKKYKCDGYKKNNTIIIKYNFPNGKNYEGTSRTAYLPDTNEGREILALLRIAFERRLLFTIGTSVTTGKINQTIWNGIHHKTNLKGGSQYFGYPDTTYFNRVKQELAAKGVIKEHIEKKELLTDVAEKFIKEKVFSNLDNPKIISKKKK